MLKRATIAFYLLTLSYYVKEFGAVRGAIRFAADRARHRFLPAGAIFKVATPRDGDIFVRARTNDLAVAVQTFILRGSDVTCLPQYRSLQERYEEICRSGKEPLIIDGGGHIATVSVLFAHLFPKARIVTIEPDPRNFEMARRNIANLPNIDLRRAALWSSPIVLHISPQTSATDSVSVSSVTDDGDTDPANTIRATTIDDIVAEFPERQLFLLKLDIEGAESQMIVPGADWLRLTPVTIVEPHDWMIAGNASLHGLLAVPDYRNGDIVVSGENLVFFPASRASVRNSAAAVTMAAVRPEG